MPSSEIQGPPVSSRKWLDFAEKVLAEQGFELSQNARKQLRIHIIKGVKKVQQNTSLRDEGAAREAEQSIETLVLEAISQLRQRNPEESKINVRDYEKAYSNKYCRIPPLC